MKAKIKELLKREKFRHDVKISTVSNSMIPLNWENYRDLLQKACDHDIEKKLTVDCLYAAIMNNESFLIEIKYSQKVVGVAVCTKLRKSNSLFVQACGGSNADAWLSELDAYLIYLAKGLGYKDGVLFCGRLGWQKKLVGLGYKSVLVTMHKEIDHG